MAPTHFVERTGKQGRMAWWEELKPEHHARRAGKPTADLATD